MWTRRTFLEALSTGALFFRGASPLGLPYRLARGGPGIPRASFPHACRPARLAAEKRRLPILGNDDETANREYIKQVVLDLDSQALRGVPSDRELGRRYGVEWAEGFHYIGPPVSRLQRYIAENAVAM